MEYRKFNVQNYLTTPEDRVAYLEAILEDGDPTLLAAGLGDLGRAVGMSELARKTGITREALYKSLVPGGNPSLSTLTKIVGAFGLRLTVAPLSQAANG